MICTPQLEDIPELIHRIQSLLPVKEAARTCVLSKSWLHAWSTIPTLRFPQSTLMVSKEQEIEYTKLINRTLRRYHSDNIPIESFDLQVNIHDKMSASYAEHWIHRVASKNCLKKIYLKILLKIDSFRLQDEIFSGENLSNISVRTYTMSSFYSLRMISRDPVINCVSLRELELINVHISEKVLDNLLSTCTLLETINLSLPYILKGLLIKVKNLRYLQELKILSLGPVNLEIYDVPRLRLLCFDNLLQFKTDLLGRVRELYLAGVIMDEAFSDLITSKFPSLENLTLKMDCCKPKRLVISGVSLKRLKIRLYSSTKTEIHIYAPKLHSFRYTGNGILPHLLFPIIAPSQIELKLELINRISYSFFHNIVEVLKLLSKFNIKIYGFGSTFVVPFSFNVDDVRTLVPAANVQKLTFKADTNIVSRENSLFFNAIFSICRPNYVKAYQRKANNFLWKQIVKAVMEKKTRKELKDVEIKNPGNRKWETLTGSLFSIYKEREPAYWNVVKFKLTW